MGVWTSSLLGPKAFANFLYVGGSYCIRLQRQRIDMPTWSKTPPPPCLRKQAPGFRNHHINLARALTHAILTRSDPKFPNWSRGGADHRAVDTGVTFVPLLVTGTPPGFTACPDKPHFFIDNPTTGSRLSRDNSIQEQIAAKTGTVPRQTPSFSRIQVFSTNFSHHVVAQNHSNI